MSDRNLSDDELDRVVNAIFGPGPEHLRAKASSPHNPQAEVVRREAWALLDGNVWDGFVDDDICRYPPTSVESEKEFLRKMRIFCDKKYPSEDEFANSGKE